jgi:hypothetical protein
MGDKHEKRRKEKAPRHVRLYHWMLNSPAWRSLSPVARSVYIQLASRYAGTNNGRISYSVREGADELRAGKTTIQRALSELEEHGFTVAMKRGAFSLKFKHATEWRLTEFHCDVTLQAATKDFMKWTPKNQKSVPVADLSVPVADPVGTCSGPVVAGMSRNGTCSGPVKAEKSSSRYLRRDTNSIPGCSEPKSVPAPLTVTPQFLESERQRARRALNSAPAARRGVRR